MGIKAVKQTLYRCSICGEDYSSQREAQANCGSYELEPARYRVGQVVTIWHRGKRRRARIVKRLRPMVDWFTPAKQTGSGRSGQRLGHARRYGLELVAKRTEPGVTLEAYYFRNSDLDARRSQRD